MVVIHDFNKRVDIYSKPFRNLLEEAPKLPKISMFKLFVQHMKEKNKKNHNKK